MIPEGYTRVRWTEKGYGLIVKLRELGLDVVEESRVKYAADPAAVEAVITAYSLAEVKAYRKWQIDQHAAKVLKSQMDQFAPSSAFVWSVKFTEARRVQSGGASRILADEAADKGVTVDALADRVVAKAEMLVARERQIAQRLSAHKDAVDAMSDASVVARYDASAGWPDQQEGRK